MAFALAMMPDAVFATIFYCICVAISLWLQQTGAIYSYYLPDEDLLARLQRKKVHTGYIKHLETPNSDYAYLDFGQFHSRKKRSPRNWAKNNISKSDET